MSAPKHLLYLHGFRSSPRSYKATLMAQAIARMQAQGLSIEWVCPQLPPSPAQAMALIRELTQHWQASDMAVVGSSLGGFYATVLAQETGCQAVLINPAVAPARDLARHIGEQSHFHDPSAAFYFQPTFIDELKALAPYPITAPQRYHALIAQGDEVLNWEEMVSHYPGAHLHVLPGNDHAISDFECHLPDVLSWLSLPNATT